MIKLTIEGREYSVPSNWSELTLEKFIEICNTEVPKKLAALYEASTALSETDPAKLELAQARYDQVSSDITEWDLIRRFPAYYGRVMKVFNIPESVLKRIHHEPRTAFFNQYMSYIVMSIFLQTPVALDNKLATVSYTPPKMDSFILKKKKYLLPESLHLMGEEIPLAEESAVTFAEAADIEVAFSQLREGKAEALPLFCAVYCREPDEVYNEGAVLNRQKEFRKLTMDVVWAVFFCTLELYGKYMNSIHGYLKGVNRLLQESSQEADLETLGGEDRSTK